jgi:hypothetical protein
MQTKSFEQWRLFVILILASILICLTGCRKHDGYMDTGPVMVDPMLFDQPRYPQTYDQSFWEGD